MSSVEAQLISEVSAENVQIYLATATFALAVYDVLLTIDQEIFCIWKRKFSAITLTFSFLRYGNIMWLAIDLIQTFGPQEIKSCVVEQRFYGFMVISALAASAGFTVLRVWAIWSRHWLALIIPLPFSIFPVITNIYQLSRTQILPELSPLPFPLNGCIWNVAIPESALQKLAVATRVCAILADLIVLIATWIKTWSLKRPLSSTDVRLQGTSPSLTTLLLRDGSTYFG